MLAEGSLGATTVSATMIGAYAAGIPLFVTGGEGACFSEVPYYSRTGLGGVHRGAQQTMDISADLMELGVNFTRVG